MTTEVPPAVLRVAQQSLGSRVSRIEPITRGGHTSTLTHRIGLADGRTFILKIADDRLDDEWLRTEQHVYRHLTGQRFLPGLIDAGDDDGHRWLLLEDLGPAGWPPPWPPGGITAVRAELDAVHVAPVPPGIEPVSEASPAAAGWRIIQEDPLPLLHAGVDVDWLERYLPTLIQASQPELVRGDALLHMDVRSENICLTRGAVLVDWTSARTGNPAVDLALWLPSLAMDTGRRPDDLDPVLDPGFAVLAAGFFACLAAGPYTDLVAELYDHAVVPPERDPVPLQVHTQVQLIVALAWAARTLGIPAPPRGPDRRR